MHLFHSTIVSYGGACLVCVCGRAFRLFIKEREREWAQTARRRRAEDYDKICEGRKDKNKALLCMLELKKDRSNREISTQKPFSIEVRLDRVQYAQLLSSELPN